MRQKEFIATVTISVSEYDRLRSSESTLLGIDTEKPYMLIEDPYSDLCIKVLNYDDAILAISEINKNLNIRCNTLEKIADDVLLKKTLAHREKQKSFFDKLFNR